MPVYPENPNLSQKVQSNVSTSVPALAKVNHVRWSKTPAAAGAANILQLTTLPTAGTLTETAGQAETQTVDPNGATGGSFSLSFGGQVTAGTSQVTNVDVGTSTGGTFTLTVLGQTTSALAFNITKAALQTALVALTSVGTGNAVVTGTDGGQSGTPFILTFGGTLANVPITVTANSASLTGGTHTVTVATATAGVGIAFNASATTVQSALAALSTIGTGNVTVTGAGPWVVTFAGTLASSAQALLVGVDGTTGGSGLLITRSTPGISSPTVARNVSTVANVSGVTGNVVVNGLDLAGAAITETLALNGTTTVVGNKAFQTITSIVLPTRTHANDTVSVGFGSKLGLHHVLPHNTVGILVFLSNVKEGTAPTVAVDSAILCNNTCTLNSAIPGGQVIDIYYHFSS